MSNKRFFFALCGVLLTSPASARIFNSPLKLKVYVRGIAETPDRLLGFTPSRKGHPVHIPPELLWYVRPMGALNAARLHHLARLMKQEKIPGLDLSDHWELTDESLSHLKAVTNLIMLDISRTRISDKGLAYLKSCRRLAILVLPQTITDSGLSSLQGFVHLHELNLDQAHITDQGMHLLANLVNLENLDLSSTRVTDHGLAELENLQRLKRIVLGALVTDASAPHLAALKNLVEVDISQTQIAENGLAALGSLPGLRTLYLPRQVTDAGLKALSKSPSLRALDLTRTAITDSGVKYLARMKTLEEVALSQTSVGNACLASLAELPELRMLELSETRVTSSGLAPLARLPKLEMLSLSWQTLSREDLQGMAKLKQLKTIVLNGVPLPEETMVQLRRLGSPSPWDSIAGLERARLRETKKTDQGVLSAPVPTPSAVSGSGSLASISKPSPSPEALIKTPVSEPDVLSGGVTHAPAAADLKIKPIIGAAPAPPPAWEKPGVVSAPLHPEQITIRGVASSSATAAVATLKETHPTAGALSIKPSSKQGITAQENIAQASAPTKVAIKKEEDNLLKVISLQSNPVHAGGFSGLSGMRQLRQTESLASINTVASGDKTNIEEQQDKPENFLGDISVGTGHSH